MSKTIDVLKVGTIFREDKEKNFRVLEVLSVFKLYDSVFVVTKDLENDEVDLMSMYTEIEDNSIVVLEKEITNEDSVNHPSHYTKNTMECLDFITLYNLDYYVGNAVKYLWRHKYKNGEEDLRKAVFYLTKRLELDVDSWNTRDENFTYHPLDISLLEDMDSSQLAILYSLSLLKTIEGKNKLDCIRVSLNLLEEYKNEQYSI